MELNKTEVFKHLLPRIKKPRLVAEGPKILKMAKILGRTEMYNLLKQAGVSEVCEETEEKAKVVEVDVKEEKQYKGYFKKVCWNCLKSSDSEILYKCAGCRKARYCDEKCQEKD